MTEYETAIIALQETSNLIALGVGMTQAVLIAWGLWLLRKAAVARDQLHAETMEALRQQGEALWALIERTRSGLDVRFINKPDH